VLNVVHLPNTDNFIYRSDSMFSACFPELARLSSNSTNSKRISFGIDSIWLQGVLWVADQTSVVTIGDSTSGHESNMCTSY
jgi:hypothetical protein